MLRIENHSQFLSNMKSLKRNRRIPQFSYLITYNGEAIGHMQRSLTEPNDP